MIKRIASLVRHEVRQMLPPTLFFLVALNLLVLTVALLSDDHQLSAISHISACVSALIVGKAFLLADKLPYFDLHIDRPLVVGALWSAMFYFLVTLALHVAERLLSAATGGKGFLFTAKADVAAFDWPMFLVVQLWLAMLLIIYSVVAAAVRAIGPGKVWAVLLTRSAPSDQ